MRVIRRAPKPVETAVDGAVAAVLSQVPFLLAAGHRMRGACCLICSKAIGGQPAALVGVGALEGEACDCGWIVSDLWLIHASHLPCPATQLQAAIHRGLHCMHVHL